MNAERVKTASSNKKGILYISCGVPGSGKTTYLKSHIGNNEQLISRDDIRFSLLQEGEEYFKYEKKVFDIFCQTITNYINNGINVYADATHLNEASRNKLLYGLKSKGCKPRAVAAIVFDVPLNICLERNEMRKGTKAYVPPDKVMQMHRNFSIPYYHMPYQVIYKVDENGNVTKMKEG